MTRVPSPAPDLTQMHVLEPRRRAAGAHGRST
jgi:hypothetical protein